MSTARLDISELTHRFDETLALDRITFRSEANKVIAITGPSGAGKSTICRLISGLINPTGGSISLGGTALNGMSPQARDIAYMFESYALYPHLSVLENIASPLRSPRQKNNYDAARIEQATTAILDLVEMGAYGHRLPSELSGGQKQRVALCRTLVQTPQLYLLDEPISHLDAKMRHKLRGAIRRLLVESGVPAIWCTPDAIEALSVGDNVIVLVGGKIQQQGTPEEIYLHPANTTVARLVGDPAMNILAGNFHETGTSINFQHGAGEIRLDHSQNAQVRNLTTQTDFLLGVRPTDIEVSPANDEPGTLRGEVYTVEPFGKYTIVTAKVREDFLKIKTKKTANFNVGENVNLKIKATNHIIFDVRTGDALHPNAMKSK